MQLTEKHIRQFALFYLICFLLYYVWSWYFGLLFTGMQPVFFFNKADLTGNILMLSDIQHKLIGSNGLRICFDLLYLVLPVLLVMAVYSKNKLQPIIALAVSVFSIIYNYFFSMMSFVSIEVLVAWMLIPLMFLSRRPKGFYFGIQSMRLIFILFFFSTALWKIRAGGVFNPAQMSAILISQHSYLLIQSDSSYKELISWFIDHPAVSFCFYILAFFIELSFAIGFFTRQYDLILAILFCIFILTNLFLMQINYLPWLPFIYCFYLKIAKVSV